MATGIAKTHYAEALVLNALLRNTAFTPPVNLWVALLTALGDDTAGSQTEVSGGAYARQPIAFGAPVNGASGASCANSALITFPPASAGWGTVTHFGIFDAVTAGNCIYKDALTSPVTVVTTQQPTFPASSLTILED